MTWHRFLPELALLALPLVTLAVVVALRAHQRRSARRVTARWLRVREHEEGCRH